MNRRHNSKRPVESFIVGGAATAFYNTAGAGDNLTDPTTKLVVLAENQFGIFSASAQGTTAPNVAVPAAPTIANAPVISIYQGTATSATPEINPYGYPLWNRVYEKTGDIDGRERITATRQDYVADTYSTWIVGGTAGAINAEDETTYIMKVAFRGANADELNDNNGTSTLIINQETPDFTTLGTADPIDWMVKNIVYKIDRNSQAINIDNPHLRGNYPIVAFALDTTGVTGTAANALTPGFFGVVNTTYGIKGLTLNAQQIASIQAAIAAAGYAATTGVVVTDLTTAGTGSSDAILLQALDRTPAYLDRVANYKNKLVVGLTLGFDWNTVYHAEGDYAFEGQGLGRQLALQYKLTQGQRKYSTLHNEYPLVEFPNPFDTALTYSTISIEHENLRQIDEGNISISPQMSIIAVPTAGVASLAALQAAFNTWLATGTNAPVKVNP